MHRNPRLLARRRATLQDTGSRKYGGTAMSAKPEDVTWKELLSLDPSQASEWLADRPGLIGQLASSVDQIEEAQLPDALNWLSDVEKAPPRVIKDQTSLSTELSSLWSRLIAEHQSRYRGNDRSAASDASKAQKVPGEGPGEIAASGAIDVEPATKEAEPGPLDDVAGKSVLLEDLLALKLKSGGVYFSDTVRRTLSDAAAAPEFVTDDGLRIITPYSYLRAAYIDGGNASDGTLKSAHDFFTEWLDERSETPGSLNLVPQVTVEDLSKGEGAAVSTDLIAIFARAGILVQWTTWNQKRIDARHVLAAFVLEPAGLQAFADLGGVAVKPAEFFGTLRDGFIAHLEGQAHTSELATAWPAIFAPLDREGHFAALRLNQPVLIQYPDYVSDSPATLDSDQLGVANDARALADLICLKEADPPLAVGLFGNWGAGKSTFMRMIREAVDENAAKVKEARNTHLENALPFVERVVHIEFNAWHYLDANLWASLVTHIFRELHRQSSETAPDWMSETQVDSLIERLEVVRQVEKDARTELESLKGTIKSARDRLDQIETERAEKKKTLIADHALTLVQALPEESTRKELAAAVETLGMKQTVSTVKQLGDLAGEVQTLGGRLRLLASTATRERGGAWLYVVFGIAAFVALGWISTVVIAGSELEGIKEFVAQFGFAVSAIGGGLVWLLPHMKHINKALEPVFAAHHDAIEKQEELKRRKVAAQKELDKLNAEQANKERELETSLLERERLEEIARGDRPAELLTRFIEDRASAEGYRKHLGLLSRIRRDFETMSALMRNQRRAPKAAAGQHPAGNHAPAEPQLPSIDRIVLYIDDLDRCQDKQVVEVLEAIHLLLAFDLFVVVVGVDARWLQNSLGEFYKEQLSPKEEHGNGRPTVADYLEKIFQVPFHLRPLQFGDGGNYSRLVGKLVGDVVTLARPGVPGADAGVQENGQGNNGGPAGDGHAQTSLRTVDVEMPEREETTEETMQRVMLSNLELDEIAELGPLVGQSPRAVKRFINLYRLMRTRRRGEELDAFLDDSNTPFGTYKVYLLWLALETGLTEQQLSGLIRVVDRAGPAQTLEVVTEGIGPPSFRSTTVPDADDLLANARQDFWAGIQSLECRRVVHGRMNDVRSVTIATLRKVIADVSRYSFRLNGTGSP